MSSPFTNFTTLSPRVHLHQPTSQIQTHPNTELIILCTWMDAPPKLISKYSNEYINLFPTSTILLITSTTRSVFLTASDDLIHLKPAMNVILNLTKVQRNNKINAATWSNAGIQLLLALAHLYNDTHDHHQNEPLPVKTIIHDSGPGDGTPTAAHYSVISTSPPILRRFPLSWIYSIITWIVIYTYLWIKGDPFTQWRAELLDPTILPLEKRVYMYSRNDKVSPYQAVEMHALEAEKAGCEVVLERFEGGHVGLVMVERERYWGVVKAGFEEGRYS